MICGNHRVTAVEDSKGIIRRHPTGVQMRSVVAQGSERSFDLRAAEHTEAMQRPSLRELAQVPSRIVHAHLANPV
jgi:hypothetical protein